jgi:hypothetical protein
MFVVRFGETVADVVAQKCGFNVLGPGAIGNCGHAGIAYSCHPLAIRMGDMP